VPTVTYAELCAPCERWEDISLGWHHATIISRCIGTAADEADARYTIVTVDGLTDRQSVVCHVLTQDPWRTVR